MSPSECQALVQQRLVAALSPTFLEVLDESHLHVGHPGAKSGGRHFQVTVASSQFLHKNSLACHRLIYAALEGLIGKEVHAIKIVISE